MKSGQRTVDSGQCTVHNGQRTTDSGQRTADSAQRTAMYRYPLDGIRKLKIRLPNMFKVGEN